MLAAAQFSSDNKTNDNKNKQETHCNFELKI